MKSFKILQPVFLERLFNSLRVKGYTINYNNPVYISNIKNLFVICATIFFMKFKAIIFLIILVLVSSCGEYGKVLKSTDYDLKKEKAKEYYNKGEYVKATELLSQVIPRFRATEESKELNWINAMSFYLMKDYIMAGSYFKSFIEQYPYGVHAEEAIRNLRNNFFYEVQSNYIPDNIGVGKLLR